MSFLATVSSLDYIYPPQAGNDWRLPDWDSEDNLSLVRTRVERVQGRMHHWAV